MEVKVLFGRKTQKKVLPFNRKKQPKGKW